MSAPPNSKRHDFPPEVIAHTVWLYCRFALAYPEAEEWPAERGESGVPRPPVFANEIRARRAEDIEAHQDADAE